LVLNHTPVFAQIVFFGALLSAIMSTSSATLLAPSVAFSENIVKAIYPKMSDKALLLTMRISVFVFTLIVVAFSMNSESSIFEMVESAYEITLAAAFVPLVFGLYWKRATSQGAVCSIIVGVSSWLIAKNFFPSEIWPPQLLGMVLGLFTMIIASLLPQWIPHHPALRDGVIHPR
ncbi:MAG TPA: sodium:solute symporter, partial [Limnobacter sp.]|nr:sodium:solute symporter [Limnobacter sp.]